MEEMVSESAECYAQADEHEHRWKIGMRVRDLFAALHAEHVQINGVVCRNPPETQTQTSQVNCDIVHMVIEQGHMDMASRN